MPTHKQYRFLEHTGYLVPAASAMDDHHLISIGHTACVEPWSDPNIHLHKASEEYYLLRKGELRLFVSDLWLSFKN